VSKSKLRKKILKIRKLKSPSNIKISFNKIIKFIEKKNKKKDIGGYYPVNYEINDLDLLKAFEKKKYNISLPIIKKNHNMNFYKWSFNEPLKINKYGIPEPISKKINYPDIIFVPLVAFDEKLNRLGYGGGYYDRYISKIEKKKKLLKIGLAMNCQKIKKIPISKYDQKLDYIITNSRIIK
jgi:5-formyltetrahydrofolate cyclo-ligase